MKEAKKLKLIDFIEGLPDYTVTRDTTALMIIDMQYHAAHRDFGLGKKLKDRGTAELGNYFFDRLEKLVIPNTRRLMDVCREVNIPVIYVRIKSQTFDCRELSWRYKMFKTSCPPGSKDAEILEELAPLPGEIVVDKYTSGVFNSTNIDSILHNMGIDTLIVTGVVTDGCVETSVRGAMDRNYKVLLVADCCAAPNQEAHDFALKHMHRNFALVMNTKEILRQIAEAKK